MAIGAILAARDMGLDVPRELSVIGIDDHELAAFFGLSTVAQYPGLQGERAVELLMEELQPSGSDDLDDENTPLPFELIVRSTTARPQRRTGSTR